MKVSALLGCKQAVFLFLWFYVIMEKSQHSFLANLYVLEQTTN